MIALMLLMITFMALIQTSLLAINTNVMNELRDEAVRVAEQRMNELRNTPFPDATPNELTATGGVDVVEASITRNVRGVSCSYTPNRRVADINLDNKQITLTIFWSYKNKPYQHGVSTVLRRQ